MDATSLVFLIGALCSCTLSELAPPIRNGKEREIWEDWHA